ncbi:hypothetical protein VNO77_27293 [Canavalia gladiata]|uniref:Uncharacterized protein n=1 Tax=Canavalia gladiata TaxID=3824 RepID=A0AAN9KTW0_CANGL
MDGGCPHGSICMAQLGGSVIDARGLCMSSKGLESRAITSWLTWEPLMILVYPADGWSPYSSKSMNPTSSQMIYWGAMYTCVLAWGSFSFAEFAIEESSSKGSILSPGLLHDGEDIRVPIDFPQSRLDSMPHILLLIDSHIFLKSTLDPLHIARSSVHRSRSTNVGSAVYLTRQLGDARMNGTPMSSILRVCSSSACIAYLCKSRVRKDAQRVKGPCASRGRPVKGGRNFKSGRGTEQSLGLRCRSEKVSGGRDKLVKPHEILRVGMKLGKALRAVAVVASDVARNRNVGGSSATP